MLRSCCFALVAVAATALPMLGCRASVATRPAAYELTYSDVPADIEVYPHTYYEGHPVYLYNDRWYYRGDGGRWRYYHTEPAPLYQYRQRNYIQQAPPAPRGYPPGTYGPGYNRPNAGPSSAPPAVRTRLGARPAMIRLRLLEGVVCASVAAALAACTATVEPAPAPAPVPVPAPAPAPGPVPAPGPGPGGPVVPGPAPGPFVPDGSLVVDWSIDGLKDPNACFQSGAAAIEIQILDSFGGSPGTFQQACEAFATSIALPPGSYAANALLLDASGAPRTTTIAINPFTLESNTELDIPIDFPASSFF
jgi:hypothetical protein